MQEKLELIPRGLKNPYYIISPPYTRQSAGIRCLYLLARALKLKGYPSFVVSSKTDPLLDVDLLTLEYVQSHYDHGLSPIVIYPETAMGNPLNAEVVVRYLLNYAGALGGPSRYPESNYLISYGKGMQPLKGSEERILHIPCADTEIFYPPKVKGKRSGKYFYASKYKNYFNLKTLPITDGMIEITRSEPDSMNQVQLAEIFRTAEVLYCYENTSISLEARLCGCPVILIPNESFTTIIGENEIPRLGLAWGLDPQQIEYAISTVDQFYDCYQALEVTFWKQLEKIIKETQEIAKNKLYTKIVTFETLPSSEVFLNNFANYKITTPLSIRLYRSTKCLVEDEGLKGFLKSMFSVLIKFQWRKLKSYLNEGEKTYFARYHKD